MESTDTKLDMKSDPRSDTRLHIHEDIRQKLKYFINIKKIPNIIFHGVSGCGKNTIVNDFVHDIYQNDKESIKNYVMEVN
jgi:DNA polymerase III delta prime subunit